MPNITINIRPSTGQLFQVELDTDSTTVQGLKEIIGQKMGNVDATTLKLVFSGRILKDEDLCHDCSKFFFSFFAVLFKPLTLIALFRNCCWLHCSCCSFRW